MPPRNTDDTTSVTPSRPRNATSNESTKDARRSRITEARGYHPRGRSLGEAPASSLGEASARSRDQMRPALRLVPAVDERRSSESRTQRRRSGGPDPSASTTKDSRTTAARSAAASVRAAKAKPRTRRVSVKAEVVPPRLADQGARLRLATSIVAVLFLVIAGRLIEFQFNDAPAYAAQGLAARLQPEDLPAPRGSILDRNGAVLAGSAEARYVYADPSRVSDPGATADALSPLLGVPRSELLPKLTPHRREDGTDALFEYLARGIRVSTGDSVTALNLKGIGVVRDETRVVPGHDLAANLIGFTGRDLQGLGGIEASYNEQLRGIDGTRSFEVGQQEQNLDHEIPGGYHEETPARPGSSVRLTIDRDLQFEVQRILAAKLAEAKAYTGSAVVLDVRTGEVLAQASYPFYDAANPFVSSPADRGDTAAGMAVDPGSVHKAIVFAACLQEGIVAPTDSVLVPPTITKGTTTFTDTHPHAVPTAMTLPGILAWSSNVGTITLADQLGAQKLYDYQRAFGLGEVTGEGLPEEAAGLVQPPANWSEESHGSIPIGMGVSVTPLQMAAVYAAIANGGVWVRPHLVQAVVAADGTVTPAEAQPTRRVISAENAAALRTMLEAVVVAPQATGRSAAIADYRVAGKTGTGKLVQDGQYADGEVGSFVGMAPADAPRYVVAVFTHTPGGNGGVVAGPAFAQMMEQTLLHYRVAPTGTNAPTFAIYA